jgi:hypothetical protein
VTSRGARAAGVAALVAALALGACGDRGTSSPAGGGSRGAAASGAAARAEVPVFRPDPGAWSDDPSGPAWDAGAWIAEGDRIHAWAFDLASARGFASTRSTGVFRMAVDVRRTWMRTLGLPEEWLGRVIAVEDPFPYTVCETTVGEEQVAKVLLAHGLVETTLPSGARAFRSADGGDPVAALVEGRVLWASSSEAWERIAEVRSGKAHSLRDVAPFRLACAAAPKALSVEFEGGKELRRRRDSDPEAPIFVLGVMSEGKRHHEVRALVCASEAQGQTIGRFLERVLSLRPEWGRDADLRLGTHGTVVRMTIDVGADSDPRERRTTAEQVIGDLSRALETFRERHGALTDDALTRLASDPDLLDDFLGAVPLDPWGRPYFLQPVHPRNPSTFLLRSLGPDATLDTEDDVVRSQD